MITVFDFFIAHHRKSTATQGSKERTNQTHCRRFRRVAKIDFSSWLPFSPHNTSRHLLDRISWNFVLEVLQKPIEKFRVLLKSDKNDGCFSWRPTYIYIFLTSVTVVALVIKAEDVPMAGYLCYRGYHYGSLL